MSALITVGARVLPTHPDSARSYGPGRVLTVDDGEGYVEVEHENGRIEGWVPSALKRIASPSRPPLLVRTRFTVRQGCQAVPLRYIAAMRGNRYAFAVPVPCGVDR